MYLHKESTIVVADISSRQLTKEVLNFLENNVAFEDKVLKEDMINCCEFDAEEGYDELSQGAKDILTVIQTEASKLCAAYIRLIA